MLPSPRDREAGAGPRVRPGEKIREAEAAGADYVGGEDLAEKILKEGWLEFDRWWPPRT